MMSTRFQTGTCLEFYKLESSKCSVSRNRIIIVRIVGYVKVWRLPATSRIDVNRFELDTRKILDIIGDYEFTPMEKGLESTYKWTKEEC